jgi:hypothetical protein
MGFSPCGMPFLHFAHCSPFFRNLFSRADKSSRMRRALAPKGVFEPRQTTRCNQLSGAGSWSGAGAESELAQGERLEGSAVAFVSAVKSPHLPNPFHPVHFTADKKSRKQFMSFLALAHNRISAGRQLRGGLLIRRVRILGSRNLPRSEKRAASPALPRFCC